MTFDNIGLVKRDQILPEKRRLIAVLLLLLFIGILSGCGKKIDASNGCLEYDGGNYEKCVKAIEDKAQKMIPSQYNSEKINSIDDCSRINEEFEKNSCIAEFIINRAIDSKNPDLCEEMDTVFREENLYRKIICYNNYAFKTKNPNICQRITVTDGLHTTASCVREIAFDTGNAEICNLINDKDEKFQCINYLATELKNVEICFYLRDDKENQGVCIGNVAGIVRNSEICNLIAPQLFGEYMGNIRNRCISGSTQDN